MTWRFPEPVRKAVIPDEAAPDPVLDLVLRAYRERSTPLAVAVQKVLRESVNQTTLAKLMRALRVGDIKAVEGAIDFTALGAALATELGPGMKTALRKGGDLALKALPGAGVELTLNNVIDPFVAVYMETQVAELVVGITDASRQAVRVAISSAFRAGLTQRSAARQIRGAIGLTPNQANAVVNYRAGLIEVAEGRLTRDALRSRFALARDTLRGDVTLARVDTLTERYRDRWIVHRSQVIARTEAVRAVNAGRMRMFGEAVSTGALEPEAVAVWFTTPDDRACFPENTMVSTPDGDVGIQDVYSGDRVCTPDGAKTVVATSRKTHNGSVRIIETQGQLVCSTPDHPIRCGGKWLRADSLEVGDLLEPSGHHQGEVRTVVDLGLTDSDYGPAIGAKVSVSAGISVDCLLVPVAAVDLDVDQQRWDGEVERVSAEPVLLGEGDAERFKRFTDGSFGQGLALEGSVAGHLAKLAVDIAREGAEALPAVATIDHVGGAPTGLGTVFAVGVTSPEGLAAGGTGPVDSIGPATLSRTSQVTISDDRRYSEVLATLRARLGDRVASDCCLMASSRAILADGIPDRREVFPAVLADSGGTDDPREFVVAIVPAELVVGRDAASLGESLAALSAIVAEGHRHLAPVLEAMSARKPLTVYNLQVDGPECYYAEGVLVHNCPICIPMHGQESPIGGGGFTGFTMGGGGQVAMPPSHVGCRCDIRVFSRRSHPDRFGTSRTATRVRELQREAEVEPIS